MKEYKWGVLAPGNIAHRFVKGLKYAPGAKLYAVGSRDIAKAKAFADEYGFERAYGSYAELARDKDVDIVYVASPHPYHEEHAVLCLNNKKAVVCEKPFAVNQKQASRMINCARENKVFLMEGMWTRFFPTICKTRELIASGSIGKVMHVSADFGFRAGINPENRLFSPDLAGGSLLDIGIYNISFCSMIYADVICAVKAADDYAGRARRSMDKLAVTDVDAYMSDIIASSGCEEYQIAGSKLCLVYEYTVVSVLPVSVSGD